MYIHRTKLRVRYSETDKMGYMYYGNYPQYYEVGRAEMMRTVGLTYRDLEEKYQIMMPVVTMNMRFVRPAYYDSLLTIQTTLKKLPEMFITFHMEIFNEAEELINGGTVKLCFVDAKTNKTIRAPKFLIEKLLVHF
ncbi:MAG TPA: acyl-CoA thioesterase [Saprospiraceae bacterium]|nr:acyl-CoA thioesterase [Saprospiraceae bacterium]